MVSSKLSVEKPKPSCIKHRFRSYLEYKKWVVRNKDIWHRRLISSDTKIVYVSY